MIKIKLFKNDELVLEKEGILEDNIFLFDNISYNKDNLVLVREDDNFKFSLDFKQNKAEVLIKENDYQLDLKLETKDKNISDDCHKIYYNIESEEVINNKLEITFK